MKALVLALVLACEPDVLCVNPCPGASGLSPRAGGIVCECDGVGELPFRWTTDPVECAADREIFAAFTPAKGCPQRAHGGHAP